MTSLEPAWRLMQSLGVWISTWSSNCLHIVVADLLLGEVTVEVEPLQGSEMSDMKVGTSIDSVTEHEEDSDPEINL